MISHMNRTRTSIGVSDSSSLGHPETSRRQRRIDASHWSIPAEGGKDTCFSHTAIAFGVAVWPSSFISTWCEP